MNETLSGVQQAIQTIVDMPYLLTFFLALNVVGVLVKLVPGFPCRLLPLLLVVLSATAMPFLLPSKPPGEWSPNMQHPAAADLISRVSVGLVIGFMAWAAHRFIWKRFKDKIQKLGSNGDTTFTPKPPE